MIVCFGEVLGRLMPAGHLRLRQVLPGQLDLTFAGAESNVAADVAFLGGQARYVTALPDNAFGHSCQSYFKGLGVDVSAIIRRTNSRLGLFYVENGIAQRGGQVTYDRAHSAFSESSFAAYDWDAALKEASWFFTTGISPAVSHTACETTLSAVREARQRGIPIAFDPNHRRTLWRWSDQDPEKLARDTFAKFLPEVDLLLTNGEQAADLLGFPCPQDQTPESCLATARRICERYPRLRYIALTMRRLHAAHDHSWSAALYNVTEDRLWFSPHVDGRHQPYRITQIIDRLGTGDAFAAGLLFALGQSDLSKGQRALDFATANAALAHTILGDVNPITRTEVETLMSGDISGRVVR